MDLNQDTVKIRNLPKVNELEYAEEQYQEKLKVMLTDPTRKNIDAFGEANTRLYSIQDAYRVGRRLLLEFFKKKKDNSQKLHIL